MLSSRLCCDHKDQEDFVNESKIAVSEYFPSLKDNDDYTSIINEKHYDRLKDLLDDAIEKGAHVDEINPSNEDFSQQEFYKSPTIVTNTTDDMKIMQKKFLDHFYQLLNMMILMRLLL